jgi:hypothetical protein
MLVDEASSIIDADQFLVWKAQQVASERSGDMNQVSRLSRGVVTIAMPANEITRSAALVGRSLSARMQPNVQIFSPAVLWPGW